MGREEREIGKTKEGDLKCYLCQGNGALYPLGRCKGVIIYICVKCLKEHYLNKD